LEFWINKSSQSLNMSDASVNPFESADPAAASIKALPVRAYLDQTVVPLLLQGRFMVIYSPFLF
jgi:hypothetical protein